MRRLNVVIESGEHVCSVAPGQWCQYVRTKGFGTRFLCHLFDKPLREVNEDGTPSDKPAWLGRLPECKAAEVQS